MDFPPQGPNVMSGGNALVDSTKSFHDFIHVHKFVYFIDIGKKRVNDDSTYSYSASDNFQISSKKKLSSDKLLEAIKRKLIENKLNDTAYIDSGSLILDFVKHNDTKTYKLLKPIQEKAVNVKYVSDIGKSYHSTVNNIEFSYSVSLIEGEWIELIIGRELAQAVLGNTILSFNNNSKRCYLFVLTKQKNACHVINL